MIDTATWPSAGESAGLAVANRNFLIHQYDEINRELTWQTLLVDLPAWNESLHQLFEGAALSIDDGAG